MINKSKLKLLIFLAPSILASCFIIGSYAMKNHRAVNQGEKNLNVQNIQPNTKAAQYIQAMLDYSEVVVLGRVHSVETKQEDNGIFTYITIEPINIIKGNPITPLVISHVGGTIGKTTIIASGDIPQPLSWKEGSEELLFLKYNESRQTYISGNSGKFDVLQLPNGQEIFKVPPEISKLMSSDNDNSLQIPLFIPKYQALEYLNTFKLRQ